MTQSDRHIKTDYLISVMQDRYGFLSFRIQPRDPHHLTCSRQQIDHFDTGRCEDIEEFLRSGYYLRLRPVVRFCQRVFVGTDCVSSLGYAALSGCTNNIYI
jgi:hypothetical protein